MECSICGISDKMRNVSQVISPKGIAFVCDKCALEEGYPRMRKARMVEPGKEKQETMYQRMARIAGVTPRQQEERPWLKHQDKSLKEIVDKNYVEKIKKQDLIVKSRPDLVDKFHWIIMRVRRVKGLTQGQLAERISEPEAAIKMVEQGVVPEGYVLIDKLERFLKVKLIRQRDLYLKEKQVNHPSVVGSVQKQIQGQPQNNSKPKIGFDKYSLGSLRIDDLRRMKKEEEINGDEEEKKEESGNVNVRNYNRLDYE